MFAKSLSQSKILSVLIISSLLSACAVKLPTDESQNEVVPITKKQTDPAVPITAEKRTEKPVEKKALDKTLNPKNKLSGDLLYDLLLAELALQRNDYDLAFKHYYKAAKATGDVRLAKKATRVTLFSKNDQQTSQAVELWSTIQPDNSDVQQIYVSSLIAQKRDKEAIAYLKKIIKQSDSFADGLKVAIPLIDDIDDQQRTQHFFNQMTSNHQSDTTVKLYQARIALKFSDYAEAERHINELLLIEPESKSVLLLKVNLLKKQEREEEAIQVLQQLISKMPEHVGLRLDLARLLTKNKHTKEGIEQVHILAKEELPPEVLFAISLLAIELEKLDDAKAYLERLHAYKLYASESAYFIGQLEADRDNYAEAENWFKQVKKGKYTFEAYLALAMVYARQEKFEQAFKLLDHSQGSNSKQSIDILQVKAEIYTQSGNYDKAYATYSDALELAPDEFELRYGRAMLADKFGHLALLEKDLHIILSKDADNSQTLNALGYILADKTTRYQEAYNYIERALKISPDDAATLDSMGWVLYKMGDYEQALHYLKKAYNKGLDAEIAAHYGEVLWAAGQTQKAKSIWRKALLKDPQHQVLKDVIARHPGGMD